MSTGEIAARDLAAHRTRDELPMPSRRRAFGALGALILAGALIDGALRAHVTGIGIPLIALLVLVAVMLVSGSRRGSVLVLGASAVALACGAMFRSASWLVAVDIGAATLVAMLAAGYATAGSPAELSGEEVGRRLARALGACMAAPNRFVRLVAHAVAAPRRIWSRSIVMRIVFGAVPVLVALGVLLAWADPVMRSWLATLGGADAAGHGIVALLGAVAASSLVAVAVQAPVPRRPLREPRVGPAEATVVVAGTVALYALFAVTQGVALVGGDAYVQGRTGLTYAEYARSGFFQLIVAAVITVGVLMQVRALCRPGVRDVGPVARRWILGLGLASVVLTLGSVAIAIRRLGLYEDAFGLTTLRFVATAFAVWLAVVLVIVAVALTGAGAARRRLVPAVGVTAIVGVAVLTIVNPAGYVASHNIDRAARGAPLDIGYATTLSRDAMPTLVAGLDRLPPETARQLIDEVICAKAAPRDGLVAWNLAVHRAETARRRVC